MTKDEADVALKAFISLKRNEFKKMKRKNPKTIFEFIIVTGKGKHSKNAPVIKPFVDEFLNRGRILHHECGTGGGYK
jgi:DNA-nicking Smr family endonuclease